MISVLGAPSSKPVWDMVGCVWWVSGVGTGAGVERVDVRCRFEGGGWAVR